MGYARLALLSVPAIAYASGGVEGVVFVAGLLLLLPLVALALLFRLGEGDWRLLDATRARIMHTAKKGAPQPHQHHHQQQQNADGHGHSHSWSSPEGNPPPGSIAEAISKLKLKPQPLPPHKPKRSVVQKILLAFHGYVYGCWPDRYIWFMTQVVAPVATPEFRKAIADTYHGKILTHDDAKKIVGDTNVPLQDVGEQVIPYPVARNIVLGVDKDIVVLDCPCRMTRANPCKPIDVCLLVGSDHSFLLEHHPDTTRRITKQEALKILRSEHRRGHVHTAYFKDVANDSFFALCNCCKCCCGGVEMMVKYGCPILTSSGYIAQVDVSKCENCNTCELTCPFGAITMHDGHSVVDREKCMGCGACEGRCPQKAIKLVRDESKPKPLDVHALAKDW